MSRMFTITFFDIMVYVESEHVRRLKHVFFYEPSCLVHYTEDTTGKFSEDPQSLNFRKRKQFPGNAVTFVPSNFRNL